MEINTCNKILLIHSSRFSRPQSRTDGLPLGVLHVAAGLKHRNIPVNILDLNIDHFSEELLNDVAIVGISCTSYSVNTALQAAKLIRNCNSNIPIIWGGVHPSLDPLETVKHPLVDGVIAGEGDFAFADVCEHIFQCLPLSTAPYLTTRSSKNASISTVSDLDTIPPLPYELLPLSRYNLRVFDVHTARGCPYSCTFCYNQSKDYRSKSPSRIYEDIISSLRFFNPSILVFCEDLFFSDRNKVAAVCEMLIERQIDIPWTANCRIEYIIDFDETFWQLLKKSKCSLLKVGVESGSERMQKLMGRSSIKYDMVLKAVELCAKHNIGIKLNFIVGLPGEKVEDILATLRLIVDCIQINPDLERVAIGVYDPYPGTGLWPIAIAAGYDAPRTLEDWSNWKGEIKRLGWISDNHLNVIKNLLFLCLPFDQPYENSLDGLWCRQPRVKGFIEKVVWSLLRRIIRQDCRIRAKMGTIDFVPERFLFERIYYHLAMTSAPQPGMD